MAGIVLDVCPSVAFLLMTMLVANLTKTIDVKDGISGFTNIVPWFLFLVLSFAKAITKTTLGMRLAYIFMKYFGKGTTGLSYSIILTESFLAPVLPSNTARAASVGLPLVSSLSKYISTNVDGVSEKNVGGYLTILYSYSNAVCSAMFLTAMISNAIILEALASFGIEMTWIKWLEFSAIPCVIVLLSLPFVVRLICKPKIHNLGNLRNQAAENYADLGKITRQEKIILSTIGIMLVMWIFSNYIGIPIFVTTLLGVCVFILLGILEPKEIISSYGTFNSVLMLGILISYVNCLNSFGVVSWFNEIISTSISGFSHYISFILLGTIYFFSHYFFSGEGTRIIALYVPFLTTGVALGLDKFTVAMTLAVFSSFSGILAHYSGPIALTMFSSGYISSKKWFLCGVILAVFELIVVFSYAMLKGI